VSGTDSLITAQILPRSSRPVADELAARISPAALLDRAWALEAVGRLNDRREMLAGLAELVSSGTAGAAPEGRDWQLELWAEEAIDAAAAERLEDALALSGRVLATAAPSAKSAVARATLARGRALAWTGTEEGTRAGEALLTEAAGRFRDLDRVEWEGFTQFWRGHAIYYENGRLIQAEAFMAESLQILPYSSPRRPTVLGFYADVLADLGEWDRADAVLDEAYSLAETANSPQARAYVAWSRAHTAAGRGDAVRAERLFLEVERDATDWFDNYGGYFLCDAARTLDTLGLTDQAHGYLRRAAEQLELTPAGSGQPSEDFEPLSLARALILARAGDPALALEELQGLVRRRWLEKRLLWRFTLMGAWATLRAGDRLGAGIDAARALDQAAACGGIRVALAGEPDITRLLAPLADEAGSPHARGLLSGGTEVIVRLFGTPQVSDASGTSLELPAGKPSELVRMLAVSPHGLALEVVLEAFFPDAAPSASRHRLRQVLTRLRAAAGDIVIRDGEILRLAPAWVDVREFRSLAQRARAARGTRALVLANAALALADRGPLLVTDPYAAWAEETREAVEADVERLRDTAVSGR
jgi:tetratricopeptide (TPR) repeat protein